MLSSLVGLEANALSSPESSPMIQAFNHVGNACWLDVACAWNAERFADEDFSSRRSYPWDSSACGGAASKPTRGRRAQLGMPRPGPCGTSTCPSSIAGSGVSEAKRQSSGTHGISNQRVAEEANP